MPREYSALASAGMKGAENKMGGIYWETDNKRTMPIASLPISLISTIFITVAFGS